MEFLIEPKKGKDFGQHPRIYSYKALRFVTNVFACGEAY
jgi:hypothetical protein